MNGQIVTIPFQQYITLLGFQDLLKIVSSYFLYLCMCNTLVWTTSTYLCNAIIHRPLTWPVLKNNLIIWNSLPAKPKEMRTPKSVFGLSLMSILGDMLILIPKYPFKRLGFRALFFYLHVCTTPKPDFQVFNFETFHLLKIIFDTVNTCIIDLSR